ncbi:MAG: tRNA (guanosine(37)-N1)-methyltransferase TrmD [Armatimonadetes bacterium]|nr:tRNA (guanosine(37)-N1)-methyltransferase TrmD [Armatimonadota bacterium]NIO76143.1 tRNA (guanosine(37)-N1)-methyltransferase TrmD [Armatimonadota bacterium]NIO98839.1 tRNA (guanosine(37)-N1)-methyltransferase TrmD [Armatimonadota bacterium]
MLKFDVITIFPGMFAGPLNESILARAQERDIISVRVHDLRDYAPDKHHVTDDYPHGGGVGMVMKPEPIFAAVEALRCPEDSSCKESVILLSPQGRTLKHSVAGELARLDHLILVCGHYEGVDERVREYLVDDEISIGDYVLTGGELPAMIVIDTVARLVSGVIGAPDAPAGDSFAEGLLEYPQYTRPADFRGLKVPEVLLSGNHEEIRLWRRRQTLLRTLRRRPDLLEKASLTKEDEGLLRSIRAEGQESS